MAKEVKRKKEAESETVAIINEVKSCHGQEMSESCKVVDETNSENDGWKKYGDLYVRCTYGDESLTDLLIAYAIGLASLNY